VQYAIEKFICNGIFRRFGQDLVGFPCLWERLLSYTIKGDKIIVWVGKVASDCLSSCVVHVNHFLSSGGNSGKENKEQR
jgi:hypothetical protein